MSAQGHTGEGHGNVANFEIGIGGPGIPSGRGGFLPGTLAPVTVDGFPNSLDTFETSDGRKHSGGKVRSADVRMTFYTNDPIQMAMLDAWWAASKVGAPGYKPPVTSTVRETNGNPAIVYETEEVFMTSYDGGGLDRNAPDATMVEATFNFYNTVRVPI